MVICIFLLCFSVGGFLLIIKRGCFLLFLLFIHLELAQERKLAQAAEVIFSLNGFAIVVYLFMQSRRFKVHSTDLTQASAEVAQGVLSEEKQSRNVLCGSVRTSQRFELGSEGSD